MSSLPTVISPTHNDFSDGMLDRLTELSAHEDPGPHYARLRRTAPVHLYPAQHLDTLFGGEYLAYVSRYAEARHVLTSRAFQAPDLSRLRPPTGDRKIDQMNHAYSDNILTSNPPEHTNRRKLMGDFFSARRLEVLRGYAESYCREALDGLVERLKSGAEVDVHRDLSEYVGVNTVGRYIGISEADREVQKLYPVILLEASAPVRNPQTSILAAEAVDAQISYFSELLQERQRAPKDDVASELVAFGAAHGIPERDLVDVLWGMWITSFVTTVAAIDAAIVRMVRHPDEAERIRRHPKDIDAFISETLRLDSPFTLSGAARSTAEETELGGVVLPPRTNVLVMLGAVNRDPDVFENPDEFRLERDFSTLMTFGHGIHYCIGARLARMEMSIVLTQLCERLPGKLVIRDAVRYRSAITRRYERLSVALQ